MPVRALRRDVVIPLLFEVLAVEEQRMPVRALRLDHVVPRVVRGNPHVEEQRMPVRALCGPRPRAFRVGETSPKWLVIR